MPEHNAAREIRSLCQQIRQEVDATCAKRIISFLQSAQHMCSYAALKVFNKVQCHAQHIASIHSSILLIFKEKGPWCAAGQNATSYLKAMKVPKQATSAMKVLQRILHGQQSKLWIWHIAVELLSVRQRHQDVHHALTPAMRKELK